MLFEIPLIFLRVETLGLRQTLNIWESVFHNSVLMLHLHTHKLKYHEMPCSFETERLQCKSIIFMSNPFRDRFTAQKTLNKKEMKIFITCLLFLISQMAAIGFLYILYALNAMFSFNVYPFINLSRYDVAYMSSKNEREPGKTMKKNQKNRPFGVGTN